MELRSIVYLAALKKFEVTRDRTILKDGAVLVKQSYSEIYHRWERPRFLADLPAEGPKLAAVIDWYASEPVEGGPPPVILPPLP